MMNHLKLELEWYVNLAKIEQQKDFFNLNQELFHQLKRADFVLYVILR